MALRGNRIENFDELRLLVALRVSSASFQKSNIGWPQHLYASFLKTG
jgi:hypothetical protein